MPDYDEELWETAHHEACHFVMGMLAKGGLPRRVTITPGPGHLGLTGGAPGATMPKEQALFALAGVYGEDIYVGGMEAEGDTEEAEKMLRQVYGDDWERQLNRYLDFVYRLLSYTGPRRAIQAVAAYLVEHPNLEMEAVYPLHDLAIEAIGKRFRWLRGRVDEFMGEV